jgi:hypothetical protein
MSAPLLLPPHGPYVRSTECKAPSLIHCRKAYMGTGSAVLGIPRGPSLPMISLAGSMSGGGESRHVAPQQVGRFRPISVIDAKNLLRCKPELSLETFDRMPRTAKTSCGPSAPLRARSAVPGPPANCRLVLFPDNPETAHHAGVLERDEARRMAALARHRRVRRHHGGPDWVRSCVSPPASVGIQSLQSQLDT